MKKTLALSVIALSSSLVLGGCALNPFNRQPATPQGDAVIYLENTEKAYQANQLYQLPLVAQLPTDQQLSAVQYIAFIDGNIPSDLAFIPNQVEGLNLLVNTIEPDENGRTRLALMYVPATLGAYYTPSESRVELGKLQFTSKTEQNFSIDPDEQFVKVIVGKDQIITEPADYFTYQFSVK